MKPYYRNQSKVQKKPLSPFLPTLRPCLDSLRLPISRPCQYHPVARPAMITSSCYRSCTEQLPVCHCDNGNYCSRESCSNSNNCKRSNPYLCPHGFHNQNANRENLEENEISDEEFCDKNEFVGDLGKINFELCQEDGSDRTPRRYSLINSNTNFNKMANAQNQWPRFEIDSKCKENKDLNTCCFENKDHITSNTNKTVLADPESSLTNKNANADSSNFYINNQNMAAPEVYHDDNQVPNDISLTGFHQRYLRSSQDFNKSSQQTAFGSAKFSQTSKSTFRNNNFSNESTSKNDASNQCCLPPYIHAAQPDTSREINHIEEVQGLKKQNPYKTTAKSLLELNDNLLSGNVNEETKLENTSFSKISQSTNTSNKRHQSFQRSPLNHQMPLNQDYKDHTSFPESSYKGFFSKAGCCKASENSWKNIQDTLHYDDFSNNNNNPEHLQNQAKIIPSRRTQVSEDPNYDDVYDSTAGLTYRQESGHYYQKFHGFGPNNTNKKFEYKRDKVIQKSSDVECGCSKYYERNGSNENDVQCRKNACIHDINTSACASISCPVSQAPACQCRYPPAFKQFNCVGNITGACNCSEYNY